MSLHRTFDSLARTVDAALRAPRDFHTVVVSVRSRHIAQWIHRTLDRTNRASDQGPADGGPEIGDTASARRTVYVDCRPGFIAELSRQLSVDDDGASSNSTAHDDLIGWLRAAAAKTPVVVVAEDPSGAEWTRLRLLQRDVDAAAVAFVVIHHRQPVPTGRGDPIEFADVSAEEIEDLLSASPLHDNEQVRRVLVEHADIFRPRLLDFILDHLSFILERNPSFDIASLLSEVKIDSALDEREWASRMAIASDEVCTRLADVFLSLLTIEERLSLILLGHLALIAKTAEIGADVPARLVECAVAAAIGCGRSIFDLGAALAPEFLSVSPSGGVRFVSDRLEEHAARAFAESCAPALRSALAVAAIEWMAEYSGGGDGTGRSVLGETTGVDRQLRILAAALLEAHVPDDAWPVPSARLLSFVAAVSGGEWKDIGRSDGLTIAWRALRAIDRTRSNGATDATKPVPKLKTGDLPFALAQAELMRETARLLRRRADGFASPPREDLVRARTITSRLWEDLNFLLHSVDGRAADSTALKLRAYRIQREDLEIELRLGASAREKAIDHEVKTNDEPVAPPDDEDSSLSLAVNSSDDPGTGERIAEDGPVLAAPQADEGAISGDAGRPGGATRGEPVDLDDAEDGDGFGATFSETPKDTGEADLIRTRLASPGEGFVEDATLSDKALKLVGDYIALLQTITPADTRLESESDLNSRWGHGPSLPAPSWAEIVRHAGFAHQTAAKILRGREESPTSTNSSVTDGASADVESTTTADAGTGVDDTTDATENDYSRKACELLKMAAEKMPADPRAIRDSINVHLYETAATQPAATAVETLNRLCRRLTVVRQRHPHLISAAMLADAYSRLICAVSDDRNATGRSERIRDLIGELKQLMLDATTDEDRFSVKQAYLSILDIMPRDDLAKILPDDLMKEVEVALLDETPPDIVLAYLRLARVKGIELVLRGRGADEPGLDDLFERGLRFAERLRFYADTQPDTALAIESGLLEGEIHNALLNRIGAETIKRGAPQSDLLSDASSHEEITQHIDNYYRWLVGDHLDFYKRLRPIADVAKGQKTRRDWHHTDRRLVAGLLDLQDESYAFDANRMKGIDNLFEIAGERQPTHCTAAILSRLGLRREQYAILCIRRSGFDPGHGPQWLRWAAEFAEKAQDCYRAATDVKGRLRIWDLRASIARARLQSVEAAGYENLRRRDERYLKSWATVGGDVKAALLAAKELLHDPRRRTWAMRLLLMAVMREDRTKSEASREVRRLYAEAFWQHLYWRNEQSVHHGRRGNEVPPELPREWLDRFVDGSVSGFIGDLVDLIAYMPIHDNPELFGAFGVGYFDRWEPGGAVLRARSKNGEKLYFIPEGLLSVVNYDAYRTAAIPSTPQIFATLHESNANMPRATQRGRMFCFDFLRLFAPGIVVADPTRLGAKKRTMAPAPRNGSWRDKHFVMGASNSWMAFRIHPDFNEMFRRHDGSLGKGLTTALGLRRLTFSQISLSQNPQERFREELKDFADRAWRGAIIRYHADERIVSVRRPFGALDSRKARTFASMLLKAFEKEWIFEVRYD